MEPNKTVNWIKETPKEENWKGMLVKLPIPPKFNWRGVSYLSNNLTRLQIETLAADKGFGHIVAEAAKASDTDLKK